MNLEELVNMDEDKLTKMVNERVEKLMEGYEPPDLDQLVRFTLVQAYGPAAILVPELRDKVKATFETDPEAREKFMNGHRALQHNIYVESVILEIANDAMTEALEGKPDA